MPKRSKQPERNARRSNSFREWCLRHRIVLILSLILVLAAFLRFYDLGAESIWLDEAESIKESALSVQGIADHTNQPPLYFLILRGWISLFGTGELALRSLSAIFGILAVAVIFLAGKALYHQRIGLIAAFLSSFAALPIFHSQDARAYSLLLLLSLVSYWCFIEILKKKNTRWYPAYFVSTILMIYTHFYGLFILVSQVIFFLIFLRKYPEQRWKSLATLAAVIAALIPFAWLLKDRISAIAGTGFWIPRPGFSSFIDTLVSFSGFGSTRYALFALFLLLAILGLFTLKQVQGNLARAKSEKHPGSPDRPIQLESPETNTLLLLWLFLPILIPFIESQFMTPIYQAKYTIGAFPALCLLVASGLNNIRWQWLFYPVLILIVVLSSIGLSSFYKSDLKEQWREVVQLVDSNSRPQDVIVICEGYFASPFNYYYKGNLREVGISSLEDAQDFVRSENAIISDRHGRFWFVMAYNRAPILNFFVTTYGQDSIELVRRYQSVTVYLFEVSGSAR